VSDISVVCRFMEPNPCSRSTARDSDGGWWRLTGYDPGEWQPANYLTLDRLYKVEERLTDEQWRCYLSRLDGGDLERSYWDIRKLTHASAAQKITALAHVLRMRMEDK
jgi:hypothetical protein